MTPYRELLAGCLAGACWLTAPVALAQEFPEGVFRIIVPTTPGSTPDVLARTLAPRLSERIGRSVVVENRTGASGNIGTAAVVHAAPNGATVLIAASTLATGASLQASTPFNAIKDLAPVSFLGWSRLVLATHASSGYRTIEELLVAAKAAPGKLTYGSPGNGTPNHLTAELFKVRTGAFMLHIPYRGSAQQLTDLLGGQIDMAPLTAIATAPHVRSGKLVALAVAGAQRSPLLPAVPSLAERGIADVDGSIWYGMFAPVGTPAALIDRLNATVAALLREFEGVLNTQGFEVETSTPAQLGRTLERDTERWEALVRRQGIKGD